MWEAVWPSLPGTANASRAHHAKAVNSYVPCGGRKELEGRLPACPSWLYRVLIRTRVSQPAATRVVTPRDSWRYGEELADSEKELLSAWYATKES